jgi:penicillin-binding protein 1A
VSAVFVAASSSLPQIMAVSDYKPRLVSDVFARGGERIGEYKYEVRKLVTIDKVPKQMIDAFLAIEDRQFYEHTGINYLAIARAMLTNLTSSRTQGASTITQQLAKQLFLSPERTYTRKNQRSIAREKVGREFIERRDSLFVPEPNLLWFGRKRCRCSGGYLF